MSKPPVFSELSLEEAIPAAQKDGKLLLVDVMADWCQPCHQMDRTTWRAPEVETWVREHALAVQLDGDKDRSVATLEVMAFPTVIAFRGGEEIDRISGARPPEQFLSWLDGLLHGRTELDELRQAAPTDLQARLQLAQALAESGRDDEATREFAWLWEHALEIDGSWVGVRHSFLISALEPLVERSAAAREAFAKLRDGAKAKLPQPAAFRDWLTLSTLLGKQEQVVEWFDSVDPRVAGELDLYRDHRFLDIVRHYGRWARLGQVIKEPVEALRAESGVLEKVLQDAPADFPKELIEETTSFFRQNFREVAATLVRSLRAAGRDADAEATADEAKKLDSSPEMATSLAGVAASH